LLSADQAKYHYHVVHKNHVKSLNFLVENTPFSQKTLEELIVMHRPDVTTGVYGKEENAIYHHAAQCYNHLFSWLSIRPGGAKPSKAFKHAVGLHFGEWERFIKLWRGSCRGMYGSGYMWLIDNQFEWQIVPSYGAGTPVGIKGVTPLLCLDLWEHAYCKDFSNDVDAYVKAWMEVANWEFVLEMEKQGHTLAMETVSSELKDVPKDLTKEEHKQLTNDMREAKLFRSYKVK